MKVKTIFNIMIPLLEKEFNIRCYIYVEKSIIIDTEIDEEDLSIFKKEFYTKYLLEYGDLKINFIDNTFNRYLEEINSFLDIEVAKEKKRIDNLLSKLNKNTIEFLKIADTLGSGGNKRK